MDNNKPTSIDEYIASVPQDVQELLTALRETINSAAPEATEKISYGMPAFALKGNLVYFAVWKNHVGFYAGSSEAVEAFQDELSAYDISKGTIKFPFDEAIPHELIRKIVQYRVAQNIEKAEQKAKKKKK